MIRAIQNAISPAKGGSIAPTFSRLGWWGFWLQVAFGSLPVLLMAYYFSFSHTRHERGFSFVEYLTLANLLILLFTAFWFYRYTRLAKRIAAADRPAQSSVLNNVWTGVIASITGMFFSMIVLLIEAANLLFYFLKAPQGGMPVIQPGVEGGHFVSSIDMVSLMALIMILFCELIVLLFGLWLLFRTSVGSLEYPKTVEL